jgi:hypothetical protein
MRELSDSYAEALAYSEQSLVTAVTPFDRSNATNGKGCALVLLRKIEEGMKLLETYRHRCIADGELYALVGSDGLIGVSDVLAGKIAHGINLLEKAIVHREEEGYRSAADWYRFFLCEVYLEIIGGKEKPPFLTLIKNLAIILKVMITASTRVSALVAHIQKNQQFDPAGHHAGHAQMILGLLYKTKKKRALAIQHLNEARRILSQFGQTPILARVETALAELKQ